jgi:hypothetical protein
MRLNKHRLIDLAIGVGCALQVARYRLRVVGCALQVARCVNAAYIIY